MGCGAGAWTRRFNKKGCKVIGIDISTGMLNLAKSLSPKIKYSKMNIFDTSFKNKTFDIVFLGYVLHHFSKKEIIKILKEAHRISKDDGIVVSIDPNLYNPLNFLITHPKSLIRDKINYIPEERPLNAKTLSDCYMKARFLKVQNLKFSFISSKTIEKTKSPFIKKLLIWFDKTLDSIPGVKFFASNVLIIGEGNYDK
jgi:ubiquinone/menaquinone biosynthesis C-methylase UbiE